MKTQLIILGLAVGSCLWTTQSKAEFEVSAGISIQSPSDFYQPLNEEGMWVDIGTYGRCWRPAGVTMEWRPYCNGHWEWTDCGWYWESDDPWAWACYHYGNWVYDTDYGWVWVPGVQWAPAWVYWRTSDDYIGWAPCPPAGVEMPGTAYVFVRSGHFHDHIRPDRVIINNTTVINQTTVIRDVRRETREIGGRSTTVIVNNGPRVETVARATGHHFTPMPVETAFQTTIRSAPASLRQHPAHAETPTTPTRAYPDKPTGNPYRSEDLPHNNDYTPRREVPAPATERYRHEQSVPTPGREQSVPAPDYHRPANPPGNRQWMTPQVPPGSTVPREPRAAPPLENATPRARETAPLPSLQPRPAPAKPSGQPGLPPSKPKGQEGQDEHDGHHDRQQP